MKGMRGGMQQLMKQANQMQSRMKKVQEDLKNREFIGHSGGEAVTIKVNGESIIQSIEISEEVMQSGDVEMLQDLILTAANDAIKSAKETSSAEMEKVTGGMSIPGMF